MKRELPVCIVLFEGMVDGLPAGTRNVEGASALDDAGLLAAVAEALDFPDYYGGNWDALDECLSDLQWLPKPVCLVFRNAGEVLRDASESRPVLLQILFDASASSGLWTIFQDQARALRPWRELCTSQGIPFIVR
jgi:RNAse (barnase) inhibitor barstar